MRAFVTGIGGFAGRHLLAHLEASGDEVWGLVKEAKDLPPGSARAVVADATDPVGVARAIEEARPEAIYHLAGIASVAASWESRRETLEINFLGAASVLEAALKLPEPRPAVLLVGSAEEYGRDAADGPIDESRPLRPLSPYAVAKAAAEMLGVQVAATEGLKVVCVRAFNHTGPGQSPLFVIPEWCRAIAGMERGERAPVLEVGNLEVVRDFSDVRDIVRLYRLLAVNGKAGEVYNACSGEGQRLKDVLESLRAMAKVPFEVAPRGQVRKGDASVLVGSREKVTAATGWAPEVPFERTLRDVLEDWRGRA